MQTKNQNQATDSLSLLYIDIFINIFITMYKDKYNNDFKNSLVVCLPKSFVTNMSSEVIDLWRTLRRTLIDHKYKPNYITYISTHITIY